MFTFLLGLSLGYAVVEFSKILLPHPYEFFTRKQHLNVFTHEHGPLLILVTIICVWGF